MANEAMPPLSQNWHTMAGRRHCARYAACLRHALPDCECKDAADAEYRRAEREVAVLPDAVLRRGKRAR